MLRKPDCGRCKVSDDEKPKWVDLFGIDPDWPVSDHERENHALHRILRDLIAELVGMADQGLDSGWAPLYEVADRAEARLKGLTDE